MRFAHLADSHLGGWRDPSLKEYGIEAFVEALDLAVSKKVDFILISGDLFNNAFPSFDPLKIAVTKLKELQELNINVYAIPGSHDYSPSGRTMLEILEESGLLINVFKIDEENGTLRFTYDKKTGVKITGIGGKKGMLDRELYNRLDLKSLESEPGFKIFMFHIALNELKPKELEMMDSAPASLLPKGFDYYAGGHVHMVIEKEIEGRRIIFPGPTFPNNFKELETLRHGGFYIYDNGSTEYIPIKVVNTTPITINCEGLMPQEINSKSLQVFKQTDIRESVVLLRFKGKLQAKSISEIDFKSMKWALHKKGARLVLLNTSLLRTEEFEETKAYEMDIEEIENTIINEKIKDSNYPDLGEEEQKKLIKSLIEVLSSPIHEDERKAAYEERIKESISRILK